MNRAARIAQVALSLINPVEVWLIVFILACYDAGLFAGGAQW